MKLRENFSGSNRAAGDDGKSQLEDLFSRPLIIALLLALVTLAVYWPARQGDFLNYDDTLYYSENAHVLGGLTGSSIVWAFTTGEAANWHPLTWLSHMLDAEVFGNNPAGPHLVNLLFHAANSVLLFLLLRRLTAATWRSALVAALFALHPLHVESVAWVAERKDLLCAFFFLLTLRFYGIFADGSKVQSPKSKLYFGASLLAFAFALMSKPMAVTLPFLLLLLDWWPLKRIQNSKFKIQNIKPLLVEKMTFFALSLAACLVTLVVQQKGGAVATLTKFSISVRIENAFVSYARYLAKTAWPATLANPYPHPGHWSAVVVILSVLLFAGLCVAAFLFARKWPFFFTGWFWFVGTLVPVIGLVQVGTQAMADRYMYLPVIGLFIIFVWGLSWLAARWKVPTTLVAVAFSAILAVSAAKTRAQLDYWQNDGALFGHALAVTTNNLVAHVNLGTWFTKNGRTSEALAQYDSALKMNPQDPLVWYDLGNAHAGLGNWDEAISDYHHALQFAPDRPNVLNNLGNALLAKNQLPEAIAYFEAALKARPDFAYAHNSLGTALFKQGRFEASAREFEAALKFAPGNPLFCSNLGDTLVRLGKNAAAAECYQQALLLEPDNQNIAAKLNALAVRPGN